MTRKVSKTVILFIGYRLFRQPLASLPTALDDPVHVCRASWGFLGRELSGIVHQLVPLQESLDSEASGLPGQGINGNSAPAGAPLEKFRF